MYDSPLARIRRRIGMGMFGLGTFGVLWILTPGLPVLRAPRASAEVRAAGLELFEHEWQPHDPLARGDGLGPVFNARSCVECHFQGGAGGGGDNKHNVLAFEAFPTQDRPEVKGGLIHRLRRRQPFPRGAERAQQVLPDRPWRDPGRGRMPGLHPGFRPGPDPDSEFHGPLRRGLGRPDLGQDDPPPEPEDRRPTRSATRSAAISAGWFRGGRACSPTAAWASSAGRPSSRPWRSSSPPRAPTSSAWATRAWSRPGRWSAWTTRRSSRDLTDAQFRSLVAFVDTLPRPSRPRRPTTIARRRSERGKALFREIGCAVCHTPDVAGVEGVYSDFLLHRLDDRSRGGSAGGYRETPPVPLPEAYPLPEEWKTPPLWGVADSAPYFHDGGSPTLESAIRRHHGDAEAVTAAYLKLSADDRAALIDFLKTLRAPADAEPVSPATIAKPSLAMNP